MYTYAFPGNIEEDVLAIGARQVPYMRTKEFSEVNFESEKLLNKFSGNDGGKAIIYTASGTAAMDAVVANYVSTRKRSIVIDGGSFGHRWSQLCDYYGCPHTDVKLEFGHDINYDELERLVINDKPDTFLCQHHETSSGQLYDLPQIARICKKHNISLVVDAISSFLTEDLDMKALGIDICITSSQKGLNIPPGLAIIFLSNKLVDYNFAHKNYYMDFQENLSNLKRGQTPFSPATLLFLQLNYKLHKIDEYGLETYKKATIAKAQYFRTLCLQHNWRILAEKPSYAITGFMVNGDSRKIVRDLIEKYDIFVMPGSKNGFLRVSHMGVQGKEDLDLLAERISYLEKL